MSSTSSSSASSSSGGGACYLDDQPHLGEGTYYGATGEGNCSFPASPQDLMVAAMNAPDYAGSAVCGACALVEGPDGSVTVRIVDQCPGCFSGDLDLSPEAFAQIAPLVAGRVSISWRFVPCEPVGNLRYHVKEGSNPYWIALQVRNHRNPVATVEYLDNGSYVGMPRESYNYFVASSGMGTAPYTIRVTDTLGNVLTETFPDLPENTELEGSAQFPAACP
ncbi:MAG: expansin EXLX1 family cellulose-binding protein [Myxococcota bacterium]